MCPVTKSSCGRKQRTMRRLKTLRLANYFQSVSFIFGTLAIDTAPPAGLLQVSYYNLCTIILAACPAPSASNSKINVQTQILLEFQNKFSPLPAAKCCKSKCLNGATRLDDATRCNAQPPSVGRRRSLERRVHRTMAQQQKHKTPISISTIAKQNNNKSTTRSS